MSSLTFVISAVLTLFLLQTTDDIRLLSAKSLISQPSKEASIKPFNTVKPNIDRLLIEGANSRIEVGDVRNSLAVKTGVGAI